MTADRDTTRIVRSWLRTDEHESADRVLETVLSRLEATPQRRPLWPSRRLAPMNRVGVLLAAAAAVVVTVGVIGLNLLPGRGGPGPSGSGGAGPSESSATLASPFPSGPPVDPSTDSFGRQDEIVDGIKFSLSIPGRGWAPFGPDGTEMPPLDGAAPISINRSDHHPQGAEAMIYWTSPFGAMYTDPCRKVLGDSADASIAELASGVAAAPGTDLLSGPADVTLGGRPAKYVVVTVREDIGCDPGYFFSWEDYPGGPFYRHSDVGDTIRVWIVDVDGRNLFIAAETHPDAAAGADEDVREIVELIEFE